MSSFFYAIASFALSSDGFQLHLNIKDNNYWMFDKFLVIAFRIYFKRDLF